MELPFFEDYKTLLKKVSKLGFTVEIILDEKISKSIQKTKQDSNWIEILLQISSVFNILLKEGFECYKYQII